MIPSFLMPDSWRRAQEERHKRAVEARALKCVPWDTNMRWQQELNIKAETYKVLSLFDVKPTESVYAGSAKSRQYEDSPQGQFRYVEKVLPMGTILETAYGNKRGTVMFDGAVVLPALHERDEHSLGGWSREVWMSLTPMETMSLRPGTRRAKGSVIVAGLGLGHQLIEVSKRKQVTRLTLVERSRELIDWLLPRVRPYLARELDEVVVDDAYEALPKMSADVALVDIFKGYGGNAYARDRLRTQCKGIKFVWAWGASEVGRSLWD